MRRIALLAMGVLAACGDDGLLPQHDAAPDAVPPDPTLTEVALIAGKTTRDVDLLFVIDDSPSMLDKQANLKASFQSFITGLSSGGQLPSLHIGVVTTDVGSKGADDPDHGDNVGGGPGACVNFGKDGVLQTFSSPYITSGSFIIDENGTKNYSGATLADTFASIASAGTSGCGFEQPLHAMKRAFENPMNAGFVRPAAELGIVVLSDEDDCSMSHSTLLGPDTATLGPLQSFRCNRFGVTCDVGAATTDEWLSTGTKSGCHSNETSAYLTDIGRYKQLLDALKPDPRDVQFTAIIAPPAPVTVELRTPPGGGTGSETPAIAHACSYTGTTSMATEVADPAVRIAELATRARRGTYTSVCNPDLNPVMLELGQRMKSLVGSPCLDRAIGQPTHCEVYDELAGGVLQSIPACEAGGSPCYSLATDEATCPAVQHLKVVITRPFPAASDTWTSVRCAL